MSTLQDAEQDRVSLSKLAFFRMQSKSALLIVMQTLIVQTFI
mgnify:CR=1 FL=1